MANNEIMRAFENNEIRSVWREDEEEWCFSVIDIVRALTGSANPRNYWNMLKARLREEGNETYTNCVQLKMLGEAQTDYDKKLALKVDSLVGFVQEAQPEEWAKIEGLYGSQAQAKFLKRLADELEPHGDRGGVVNVQALSPRPRRRWWRSRRAC